MKYLLITLLCFAFAKLYSQSTIIHFTIENETIKADKDLAKLRLPIDFAFKKDDFNRKAVEILNDSNKVIALKNRKFGQPDLQALEGETEISIQIIQNGQVSPSTEGDKNIKEMKTIKLRIEGFNPIVLSFDKTSSDDTPEEEEQKSGYIYYDVIKLMSTDDVGTRKKILASYGVNSSNYMNNPYLKDVFESDFTKGGDQAGGSLLTNLGNTDVTYFAAGLARFLAERTKEELNGAFFSKMKEQLNAYPELKTAFPQTTTILNAIETYSYASVIQVLKEAFETDVQNLSENLYEIKNLTSAKCDDVTDEKLKKKCVDRMQKLGEFFDSQPGHWVALGMFSAKEGIKSTNPANLLNTIALSDDFTALKKSSDKKVEYHDDYNIVSSIELTNIISQSLISKDEKQVWITLKQLDSLLKVDAFKIYLGLILALEQKKDKDQKVGFYNKNSKLIQLDSILIKAHKEHEKYETQLKSLIKNIYAAYNAANNAVKKMVAASEKSVDVEPQALYDYYRTFTSSLKPVAHSTILDSLVDKDIGASYDKVEQFLNPAVDIAYHISTKKYSAAIYDATILLSSLNAHKITTTDKNGKAKEEKYEGFKPITKSFVKYGTLISTVANAQSSDEVKKALEASVLPVGSSSIKRNSASSISINAYVGGFYGKATNHIMEYKLDSLNNPIDSNLVKKSYQTFGLYAPIGVSFSIGSKSGWGLSFTPQLLDLGALVNFYLKEGDTTALPSDFTVRLSNIFAPGVQLGINFPKMPLSLIGGFQYVPALYETDQIESSSEILASSAVRFHVSLVVDIPMYNVKVCDFKK